MKLQWMRVRNDLMEDHRIKQIALNKEDPFIVFMRILLQSGYHQGLLRFSDNEGESGMFDTRRLAVFCDISVEKMEEIVNILIFNNLITRREDGTIEVFEASRWFQKGSDDDDANVAGSTLRMRRLRARRKAEMMAKCDSVTPVTCDASHASQESIEYKNIRDKNIRDDITTPPTPSGDVGVHGETVADPITMDEFRERVAGYNSKVPDKVSPEEENQIWACMVAANFRHGPRSGCGGRVITPTSVWKFIQNWKANRANDQRRGNSGMKGVSTGVILRAGDSEKACASIDTAKLDEEVNRILGFKS